MKLTTDKALTFSALVLLFYTLVCLIMLCYGKEIDSTLTTCVFLSFGVAEGGFCAFIHSLKKKKDKPVTTGDITGYDDAEVLDESENEDGQSDN